MSWKRVVARVRGLLLPAGVLLVIVGLVVRQPWLGSAGALAIGVGFVLYFVRTEQPDRAAVSIQPPVRGRWLAVNSPADKVPSHGTRELGQAYAVDLVHVPDPDTTWRGIHRWPPARRASAFPAFGQPVLAPAAGVVVKATGWQRDHWSRNSPWGLLYLLPEMLLRAALSVLDGRFVMGNHVILDLGDGVYAALAHLRRGSVRVRRGQQVAAGEQLAECGNSGNSSEPHLHIQLMDHRRPVVAAGLPFVFDHYLVGDEPQSGVPSASQPFTAPDRPAQDRVS